MEVTDRGSNPAGVWAGAAGQSVYHRVKHTLESPIERDDKLVLP